MSKPQRLTALWAFTTCYKDSFTFYHRIRCYFNDTAHDEVEYNIHDIKNYFVSDEGDAALVSEYKYKSSDDSENDTNCKLE
jgi:hypothetical protein